MTVTTTGRSTDRPGHSETMPCAPESAAAARRLVRTALTAWGIEQLTDDGELVISELVTNTVDHTRSDAVRVTVSRPGENVVCIAVVDQDKRHHPELRRAGRCDEVGRGLLLVSALTKDWGVELAAQGKRVWATLADDRQCRTARTGHVRRARPHARTPAVADRNSPLTGSHLMTTLRPVNAETASENDQTNTLREAMIAKLEELNAIRTEAVASAFRAVPRHLFMPEAPLEKAYAAEYALTTVRDERGVSLSSVSAARIQAFMLEQADIRPGMRVLEIGSGGFNAALIAELVGVDGEVTTIDIDPAVVERATRLLSAAGYGQVHALLADGAEGEPQHAPYDRIVVTVEAADLAAAWTDQLTEEGRIVVPLRLRGLDWSVAFQREPGRLVAHDFEVCGFVPMRGPGARSEDLVILHDGDGEEVGLRLDDAQADAEQMRSALNRPRSEAWSGVTLAVGLAYDDLELWLVSVVPEFALLTATRAARDRGVVASWSRRGVAALLDTVTGSFAYLTMRPTTPERNVFEFGAVGHGPEGAKAAERLIAEIHVWDREHRGGKPELAAYPAGTGDDELPGGRVLDRPAHRFTISWPAGR